MCSVRAHGVSCFRMINRVLPRLWLGRALALSGILLVAANLRSAVAALSPIVSYIRKDFDLDIFAVGAIGMLPPFFFAVFSSVRPASLAMWSILALVAVIPWIWLIVARPAGPPSAQDNIRSIRGLSCRIRGSNSAGGGSDRTALSRFPSESLSPNRWPIQEIRSRATSGTPDQCGGPAATRQIS